MQSTQQETGAKTGVRIGFFTIFDEHSYQRFQKKFIDS